MECTGARTTPPQLAGGGGLAPADVAVPVQQAAATAATPSLGDALAQVSSAVAALSQAIEGAGALAPELPAAIAPTAPPVLGGPAAADPLAGFTVTGDPAERAVLADTLAQIESTGGGAAMLTQVRGQGVSLDIASSAEFDAATGPGHEDAEAVFIQQPPGTGGAPRILIRGDRPEPDGQHNMVERLAHELAHAAQWVAGEGPAQYLAGSGATGLTPDQVAVGTTLMKESGAGVLSTMIAAELRDPVAFAEGARRNLDLVLAESWPGVDVPGYNPAGYQLPQFVSPAARALVVAGLP